LFSNIFLELNISEPKSKKPKLELVNLKKRLRKINVDITTENIK
jgi:hypothetical protein